jgi:aminoglycoside phosphotransferase (APT) family kinase protein
VTGLGPAVARRISSELGLTVTLEERLGRERQERVTWLADAGAAGPVVVKARAADDRPDEKTAWAAAVLPLLAARGYPVPEILWHGLLDGDWHVAVLERLPGRTVEVLTDELLALVLDLVELQADAGIEPGVRDMAAYNAFVVFDGWDYFRRDAEAAAPALVARLDRFLEPVWGRRLEARDFAHGDLNLKNVLTDGRTITGVVDWDEFGLNSRAADLTSILFDWHALALPGAPSLAPRGGAVLRDRIVAIAGEDGLRCTIGYAALGRLGITYRRRRHEALAVWTRVTEAILAELES